LLLAIASPFTKANFIVDPSSGVSVGFGPNVVDSQVVRNLGGTFDFYGTPITSIHVASDGFLGTGDVNGFFFDRTLAVLADATSGPVIAAFYDHTVFGPGTSVTEQETSSYYAITYQNLYGFDNVTAGLTTDYQIVLFGANTTLRGFDFLAGDIAMSYGNLASVRDGSVTVGVAESTSNFTGTLLSIDGELLDVGSLPTGSQFLLYRPHEEPIIAALRAGSLSANSLSEGNRVLYNVSLETMATSNTIATPEPGTLALAGLALIVSTSLRARRR